MTVWRNPPLILLAGEGCIIALLLRYDDLSLAVRATTAMLMGAGCLILQLVYWNQSEER